MNMVNLSYLRSTSAAEQHGETKMRIKQFNALKKARFVLNELMAERENSINGFRRIGNEAKSIGDEDGADKYAALIEQNAQILRLIIEADKALSSIY